MTAAAARVDFSALAGALAARAADVCAALLPAGRREGGEWRAGGIDGSVGRSLAVELHGDRAGVWHDHASGEGGDLLSLWAAVRGLPLLGAAQDAGRWLGAAQDAPAGRSGPVGEGPAEFRPTVPIPPDAGPLPAHPRLGRPVATWAYRNEAGEPLFHVARFELRDGGKQVLPLGFGRVGERYGWHWRAFPLLRPLYRLDALAARPDAPALVVEGEKCADAAGRLLPDYAATCWPGGAKAVQAADWRPLAGRRCVLWPDNDAPGIAAMQAVAEALRAVGAAEVRTVTLPESVPPGWDVADLEGAADATGKARALVEAARPADGPETAQEAPQARGFRLVPVGELLAAPQPVRWLVRGLLERDTLALLFGDPAAGKSFAALDLAACVATGAAFHGRPVEAGPVVYLAGEGHAGIARRLLAWSIVRRVPLDRAPLFVSTTALRLPEDAGTLLGAVDAAVAALEAAPVLVVVDTVARHLSGDENDAREAGAFVGALDALRAHCTGATVLAVHHSGHGDKSRSRGSSAFRGAVDTELRAERVERLLTLACTKAKDSEPFPPLAFELRTVELPDDWQGEDGEPATSAVLVAVDVPKPAPKLTDRQAEALEKLRALFTEHRANLEAAGHDPAGARVDLDDWRDRCAFEHRSTFARAKDGLITAGLVRGAGGFFHLTEQAGP